MRGAVEVDAPAKLNLRLQVLAQEASGYHSLETLFCALSLHDSLRLTPGEGGVELRVEGGWRSGAGAGQPGGAGGASLLPGARARRSRCPLRADQAHPQRRGAGGGQHATPPPRCAPSTSPAASPSTPTSCSTSPSSWAATFPSSSAAPRWRWAGAAASASSPSPRSPRGRCSSRTPASPMPTAGAFQRIAELRGGGYRPRARRFPSTALAAWEGVAGLAENDFAPRRRGEAPPAAHRARGAPRRRCRDRPARGQRRQPLRRLPRGRAARRRARAPARPRLRHLGRPHPLRPPRIRAASSEPRG